MLLRVSRMTFWLAALAAAVALTIPTGWETALTGFAVATSALAYLLWRSGLAQLHRAGAGHAHCTDAAPLTGSALHEAATLIEDCCARAGSFEAALHGVARILKTELGALRVGVYSVLGADETHVRVSELIDAQPGFHAAEHRVHLRHCALGRAVGAQHEAIDPSGAVVLPVPGPGGVVAAIEMTGMQIGIDPEALTNLLALASAQLSQRARPAARGRHRVPGGQLSARLGENA
jgi:hypothetical protein